MTYQSTSIWFPAPTLRHCVQRSRWTSASFFSTSTFTENETTQTGVSRLVPRSLVRRSLCFNNGPRSGPIICCWSSFYNVLSMDVYKCWQSFFFATEPEVIRRDAKTCTLTAPEVITPATNRLSVLAAVCITGRISFKCTQLISSGQRNALWTV